MSHDTSIFDSIQTEEDKKNLLSALTSELCSNNDELLNKFTPKYDPKNEGKYLNIKIQQKELNEIKYNELFAIYNLLFIEKEIMLQVLLYHECSIRNIDCHLEVTIIDSHKEVKGYIDAIIKFNNQFIGFECKNSRENSISRYAVQLSRYKKLRIPIIFINKTENIVKILNIIQNEKLTNEIYFYNEKINSLSIVNFI